MFVVEADCDELVGVSQSQSGGIDLAWAHLQQCVWHPDYTITECIPEALVPKMVDIASYLAPRHKPDSKQAFRKNWWSEGSNGSYTPLTQSP